MKKNQGLKSKMISRLVLSAVVTSLAAIAVCTTSVWFLSKVVSDFGDDVGAQAENDFTKTLSQISEKYSADLAKSKADLASAYFEVVNENLTSIATLAADIYENRNNYPDRVTQPPKAENGGKVTAQLVYSPGVKADWLANEIAKTANLSDLMKSVASNEDMKMTCYFASKNGFTIITDTAADSRIDGGGAPAAINCTKHSWYVRAVSEQTLGYSAPLDDPYGRGLVVIASVPVYANGTFVGVAGVGIYLDKVAELVNNTSLGDYGYAFLVSDVGSVVVSKKTKGETKPSGTNSVDLRWSANTEFSVNIRQMTERHSGAARIQLDNEPVLLTYEPLNQPLGWSFAVVLPTNDVLAPAIQTDRRIDAITEDALDSMSTILLITGILLLLITAVVTFIVVLVNRKWVAQLLRPLEQLASNVRQAGGDNYEAFVSGIKTGDEFQLLGDALSDMSTEIQTNIKRMSGLTAERERIAAHISAAADIQRAIMPGAFPEELKAKGLDLFALTNQAKKVGGDFYDFFMIDDDRIAVVIADVSGKGISASLFMLVAKTLIKTSAAYENNISDIFAGVNDKLCANNNKDDMFITAFMGILDMSSGEFSYVNAGHQPVAVKHAGAPYAWLPKETRLFLGGLPHIRYPRQTLHLLPGDSLFMYTDGVPNGVNKQGEPYTKAKLLETLNKIDGFGKLRAEELSEGMSSSVANFAEGTEQADDITIFTLKYVGAGRDNDEEHRHNKEERMWDLDQSR
ncbi:MAG: SpoIIE family protein phosphatase [Oscillospiraceae bacterium]|jgi:sigma-B regulation protein RsbU (phosphoserine phosphatase)|nr:SpoIIE family protein phosphatase [Oscillospiraceae bacterium]